MTKALLAASKAIRGGTVRAKNEMKIKAHFRKVYSL